MGFETEGGTGGGGSVVSVGGTANRITSTGGTAPIINIDPAYDANIDKKICNFRLSLTTGVPVTTTDVVNAPTIYCEPFNGNQIGLYNGSSWAGYESAEFSLALGTLTNKKLYDVFCYANAGVPTLEFEAWANDTARATGLTTQNGVLVKSGALTRRYLGTFYNPGNQNATVTITNATPAVVTYTSHGLTANAPIVFTTNGALPNGLVAGTTYYVSSLGIMTDNTFGVSATPGGVLINTTTAGSGTHTGAVMTYTEDSLANRYLWNYYNQAPRKLSRIDATATWSYTTAVVRQSNGNKLNQFNFIQGVDQMVYGAFWQRSHNNTANVLMQSYLSLDSTTSLSASVLTNLWYSYGVNAACAFQSSFYGYTGIGKHYLSMNEFSIATGATTWYTNMAQGSLLG